MEEDVKRKAQREMPIHVLIQDNCTQHRDTNLYLKHLVGLIPQQQKPQDPFQSGQKITNNPPGRPGGGQPVKPLVSIDLCYFIGDDIWNSHVPRFDWFDNRRPKESLEKYINLMTLRARQHMSKTN